MVLQRESVLIPRAITREGGTLGRQRAVLEYIGAKRIASEGVDKPTTPPAAFSMKGGI